MKWNGIKALAIKKGWKLKEHGGNHDIYYHPKKEMT